VETAGRKRREIGKFFISSELKRKVNRIEGKLYAGLIRVNGLRRRDCAKKDISNKEGEDIF